MSVNLSSDIKSYQKPGLAQSLLNNSLASEPKKSIGKANPISLNSSTVNGLNTSTISAKNSQCNSRSSLNFSQNNNQASFLKKSTTTNGKSYAKIITKLSCEGCGMDFGPNKYFEHIEQCTKL